MKIMCMACEPTVNVPEQDYIKHMKDYHSGLSQGAALNVKKNIPKQAPIVLDKDAPPPPEFMEVAKMLDEKPAPPPVPNKELAKPVSPKTMVEEKRKPLPITLEYHYAGECPECFISLKTIMVHTAGKCFAVAICMNHGQLKEREVADLEEIPIIKQLAKDFVDKEFNIQRKEVKRGRRKSKLFNKSTIPAKMSNSRMSDSKESSISSQSGRI